MAFFGWPPRLDSPCPGQVIAPPPIDLATEDVANLAVSASRAVAKLAVSASRAVANLALAERPRPVELKAALRLEISLSPSTSKSSDPKATNRCLRGVKAEGATPKAEDAASTPRARRQGRGRDVKSEGATSGPRARRQGL